MNEKPSHIPMADAKIFCKDCKHLRPIEGKDEQFWRCALSPIVVGRKYYVTGKEEDLLEGMGYAAVSRMPGQCGPDADWFEQRDRDAGLLPLRVEAEDHHE